MHASWTERELALCLSGGGYRAAGFHLGTLAYLDHVGLLKNLTSLSTVSGGTFTGASYILALIDGKPFDEFYGEFYGLLSDTHLVKLGLGLLGQPALTPARNRTLIVSMAEVYADTFFADRQGNPRLLGEILDADLEGLPEASFNATEFRSGVAFRFQRREQAVIGNGHVSVPPEEARSIRIADVVAASSCFPGGFEPLAFPDDFSWPDGKVPAAVRERLERGGGTDKIAVMDGGVYDNQGASTLDLAVEERAEELAMFMISDAEPEPRSIYEYPEVGERGFLRDRTLGQAHMALVFVSFTCLMSVIAVGAHIWSKFESGAFSALDWLLYIVPLVLASLTYLALKIARYIVVRHVLPLIPHSGVAAWDDLKQVRIGQFIDMLHLRFGSLLAMAGSVFMKRIRGLVYTSIFESESYQKKVVPALIYDLNEAEAPSKDTKPPSEELSKITQRASSMATTLWFYEPGQLNDLVATGQATTCYQLIKTVVRTHGDDLGKYPDDVRELYERLVADWEQLRTDPHSLCDPYSYHGRSLARGRR